MGRSETNRRRFLCQSLTAAAAISAPTIISSRAVARPAPSDTLRIGCIGTGRMGHDDMRACLASGMKASVNARIVAVCDLDRTRAEHAQREAETFYRQQGSQAAAGKVEVFDDFRELLARPDIDGVTISTPDHWHALVGIAAARAGKGIYLQKPLTYSVVEGQELIKAVRASRVTLQTGSQQRSDVRFHRACELVRNGRIGKLQAIHVRLPVDSGHGRPVAAEVPPQFNYPMWLGPTPEVPYAIDRVHPQEGFSRPGWLQIESYCRGMITGWGAHMFDTAQWGHGSDDSGPVEIQATGEFPARGLFNVHTQFHAEGRYADGVRLIADSGDPAGVRFEGEAGSIHVTRSSIQADPPEILRETIGESETRLYKSRNHMDDYLVALREKRDPICPVEVGHRSNTVCVLIHIAMKLGRTLTWDPTAERFVGDESANSLLDYSHRAPWTIS